VLLPEAVGNHAAHPDTNDTADQDQRAEAE
jgi:hypothetical protein